MRPLGALSVEHPDAVRRAIEAVLPPAPTTIEAVARLDTTLGRAFAAAAVRAVAQLCAGRADLVVSSGQTVFHAGPHGTLQLGQPAWIAAATGLPVLADLRSADVARGGQGAPLVPAFDALLLEPGQAAVNLGGIANITVRGGQDVIGYDTGPANALIDAAARRFLGTGCDLDGAAAGRGRVDERWLADLLAEPYYAAPAPKSTGKELFSAAYLTERLPAGLPGDDVIATLTELTARTVAEACAGHNVTALYASGGGIRNPVLMRRLRDLASWPVRTFDELGVPAQAKEAYAWALLGWLSWHGLPGSLPSVTGASEPAVLGLVTLPTAPTVVHPRRLLIT
jgi:anhydro-N-acetylmuramic acid kinase